MNIRFLVVLSALLLFAGCGEDPEAPIPTLSQEDKDIFADEVTDDIDSPEDSIDTDTLNGNISIGQAEISGIDEEGNIESDQTENIVEITPTLIEEDVDYINTQFESIFFDYDRISIKEQMLLTVSKNIELMNAPQVLGYDIYIEGNCDEWGTDEYNYSLGVRRAQVIKEIFISEGVNPERVKIVSFGESNPICLEQKDDCWAKNRRVDFKLGK